MSAPKPGLSPPLSCAIGVTPDAHATRSAAAAAGSRLFAAQGFVRARPA
jgi:hypothetical protein